MLRYLSRYTHRVAISNRRLIAADDAGVAFRWKDYRVDGPGRWKFLQDEARRIQVVASNGGNPPTAAICNVPFTSTPAVCGAMMG